MDTTKKLQTLSLCTGYGGIERGLELAGEKLRVLAHVEIEAFACANLVAKMEAGELDPAPIWANLKTLPGHVFRDAVDLLTGGYPCQPFSAAGKRQGADDPRHLWPHICRIIDEVRPRRCFFENVEGHISLGLREVLADLEARGYSTTWGIFSASEVGAPHQRKRVFILADSTSPRLERTTGESVQGGVSRSAITSQELADSRLQRQKERQEQTTRIEQCSATMADTDSARLEGLRKCDYEKGRQAQAGQSRSCSQIWPARPGQEQHNWEQPRTIEPGLGRATNGIASRVDRLRLLGNGVVPQTAALAWRCLHNNI